MRTVYLLIMTLLLSSITANAQVFDPPPCSNFNTNPAPNWNPSPGNSNLTVQYGSPNTFDGSQYLSLTDKSGGSWYENTTDYKSLGKRFLGQCLYFDFYLQNSGGSTAPHHPYITISDGVNHATFTANITVTAGSGWVRVKAPIQLANGGPLPSNSDGKWTAASASIFDNIMLNTASLILSPEVTSSPSEIVYFDNVCIKSCSDCTADFKLDTSFSTFINSATATLTLINPIYVSTPGNPGPTYTVNWGDGTTSPVLLAAVTHNYSTAGTYTICVTEQIGKAVRCKRCFTFCYTSPIVSGVMTPLRELQTITKAEVEKYEKNEFLLVPNPAKNYVDVQTTLSKKGLISIRLIDISGKVVLEKSENLNSGRQIIKLNTENLIQGNYIVELRSENKTSSQKLLISK
ncbi:T9SS type A sorting domain-containing protein [Chryseobacterium sp. OV279]|uniref:T9SS type A sorting domain-containing protein n=1 Tax=Chryseobacterium sp. OV279 TaxID=1500285 RepID=UPI00090FBA2A|nr:T9SS type A sorting domain-containing protein [Chryseobacterium sp. OV279]SHG88271.1 Por secretion system C-terminal sorting domain-containing protein [Chryseobacterium sp. OV279]